jgi:hypothetical protein
MHRLLESAKADALGQTPRTQGPLALIG